jgi:hypothetical protein
MMRLQSQGELSIAAALALALGMALAVAWFYRRETKRLATPWSWLLPLLRAAAILLALLMLAGPVLRFQKVIGTIPRVDVFVDASGSMLASDLPASESAALAPASRLDRAWKLLAGDRGQGGWLASVRQTHHVLVHLLVENEASLVWDSQSDLPLPESLRPNERQGRESVAGAGPAAMLASGRFTNLGDPIAARVLRDAGAETGPRGAVLLLTDGQHNSGSPPELWSRRLGDARVPVHAIGLGAAAEPKDVAILGVNVPASVSAGGRVGGQVIFKDLAGEGEPIRLRIAMGDQTVWQQTLTSEQLAQRRVPFDFAVAPLIDRLGVTTPEAVVERSRLTLPLRVSIDPIAGQYDSANNQLDFRVSANLTRRRLLIVDSRSRWETRYLFNLFDRDPSWQVETLITESRYSAGRIVREQTLGTFPADAQAMAAYDAVIWGDCGPEAFSTAELERLRDFAAQGGAIVFVDGDRNGLGALAASPAGALFPVKLSGGPQVTGFRELRPTSLGAEQAALRLNGDDLTDPPLNGKGALAADRPAAGATLGGAATTGGAPADDSTWQGLQPPTQLRSVEGLPGAEVWLDAIPNDTSGPKPALVTRRFGGGQVVYLAFDQTWRWRYRVADRYHNRFWNQLLEAIMQPPFEVRDQYISLAVGSPQYTSGDAATVRAQLRDASGKPVGDAIVEAVLRDDAGATQTVLLRGIDGDRGIYEGRTVPLAAGNYEISIRAAGYQESRSVRTSILVVAPPDRESARLSQDADLLGSLAETSGGIYADEQHADRVWRAIEPLSDGRIETRRYPLAESFPWFFMLLGLLTAEWWFRKQAGLI